MRYMYPFPLRPLVVACLLLVLTAVATWAAESVSLAVGGKALMPIIISEHAAKETKDVAAELAVYLQRITGATFQIQTGDGKKGIVLGTIGQFPTPALAKALEIRNGVDGKEAYAIQTDKNRILLLGGGELGASHAAFRLLEYIGCRWFFPAKEWEVVPVKPSLTVKLEETDRPAILSRRIWYGYGFFPDDKHRPVNDYLAWARHNRMACSRTISCGHAWQSIIGDNNKIFDAHPEYLALTGGKRQGEQLCVSNPAVRKLAAEWAVAQLRGNPNSDMVSMECSDGNGQCECDNCKKLGSVSDRVFGLANDAAKAVGKEFPGKMIGLYAYNEHCEPPSFPLEPNVYVQSTAGFITGKYTFDELMNLWPKVCQNMGFYLYFSVWFWDNDMLPGGAAGNTKYIRETIPRLYAKGATSIDCESGDNWGPHGRGYYLANRLMWNPKADATALLNDFYTQAFGPAAKVMQRYYERLDGGNQPLVSENLLAQALRDLRDASRLTDRPDVQARLDQLKQYLHYVRLRWDADRATDKEKRKQLVLATLTHVYRTRFSYMNHWEAMRQSWTTQAADEFKEPTWSFSEPTNPKPWAVETPYTHAETEQCFQQDLARFKAVEIQTVKYSDDLVPGGFHTDAPAPSSQSYQNPAKYALYSNNGEPLEFSVTAGLIAWYRNHAEAEYQICDAAGKEIAKGRISLEGKAHPLSIKVPAAGLYWLVFNDQGTGWNITADAGKPITIALSRNYHPTHLGWMQRMYFYVPKGMKQIQFYWNGGLFKIFGPDGKLRAQISSKGKFISGAVPVGDDGKVWSLGEFALGELYFTNLPNYIAASPDALLVPSEVAKKDKLGAPNEQATPAPNATPGK